MVHYYMVYYYIDLMRLYGDSIISIIMQLNDVLLYWPS